jgi:hypothetical protein
MDEGHMSIQNQNKKLNQLLRTLDQKIDRAKTLDDILSAIDLIRQHPGPLKYDHTVGFIFLAIGIIAFAAAFTLSASNATNAPFLIGAAGLIAAIISLIIIWKRSFSLDKRESRINELCSWFSNGLTVAGSDIHHLSSLFRDYDRGNYSRDLPRSLSGYHPGGGGFSYQYHHLHYVDRIETMVTTTDAKGNTTTHVVVDYNHYHRFSMVIPATAETDSIRNLSVTTNPTSGMVHSCRWDTSLEDFNRAFTLSGKTEMSCVKFARPPMVLHLLTVREHFRDLNLEYASDGSLCISFANNDLLSFTTPSTDIRQADAYYQEIAAGIALPRLQDALLLIERIISLHREHA